MPSRARCHAVTRTGARGRWGPYAAKHASLSTLLALHSERRRDSGQPPSKTNARENARARSRSYLHVSCVSAVVEEPNFKAETT
jgi:hypothetical protein